jgi:hypothetical protein
MPYIIETRTRDRGEREGDRLDAMAATCAIPAQAEQLCQQARLARQRESVSRVAVATLDEAREVVAELAGIKATGFHRGTVAKVISEQGGTVGPLPDGTTIEVTFSRWIDLIDPNDPARTMRAMWAEGELHLHKQSGAKEQILDAFNAQEVRA